MRGLGPSGLRKPHGAELGEHGTVFGRGDRAHLAQGDQQRAGAATFTGDGYFYFWGGEAADWLDRTVRVPTLHRLTLDQWMQEFQKLRETDGQLMRSVEKLPLAPPLSGWFGKYQFGSP